MPALTVHFKVYVTYLPIFTLASFQPALMDWDGRSSGCALDLRPTCGRQAGLVWTVVVQLTKPRPSWTQTSRSERESRGLIDASPMGVVSGGCNRRSITENEGEAEAAMVSEEKKG